jgi:hypothetical protein
MAQAAQTAQEPATDHTASELHLTLRLDLHLRRSGPHSTWSAELDVPDASGTAGPLSFATLPELIGFIARLDQTQPGGLR